MKTIKKIPLLMVICISAIAVIFKVGAAASYGWVANGNNVDTDNTKNIYYTITELGDVSGCGGSAGPGECNAEDVLTLNNYNGGTIYFFSVSKSPVAKIKLIGENHIVSKDIGIIGSYEFIGDGTLEIDAPIPILGMYYDNLQGNPNSIVKIIQDSNRFEKSNKIKIDLSSKEDKKTEKETAIKKEKEKPKKETKTKFEKIKKFFNLETITIIFVGYFVISLIIIIVLGAKNKGHKQNKL